MPNRRSPLQLPGAVIDAKERLARLGEKDARAVLEHLTNESKEKSWDDHTRMWCSLERWAMPGDPQWVITFLGLVKRAQTMPRYYALSFEQRKAIEQRIRHHSGRLAKFLSDLGDAYVEVDGKKVPTAGIVTAIADMALVKISDADRDPLTGSHIQAKQNMATRFARRLAAEFKQHYGKPLDAIVATVTNRLYATRYEASDVHNLRTRVKRFAIRPPRWRSFANRKTVTKAR